MGISFARGPLSGKFHKLGGAALPTNGFELRASGMGVCFNAWSASAETKIFDAKSCVGGHGSTAPVPGALRVCNAITSRTELTVKAGLGIAMEPGTNADCTAGAEVFVTGVGFICPAPGPLLLFPICADAPHTARSTAARTQRRHRLELPAHARHPEMLVVFIK